MKQSIQSVNKRREALMNLLKNEETYTLSVETLADRLKVSVVTVRRDLAFLEKIGMVARSYGQATLSLQAIAQRKSKTDPITKIHKALAARAASYLNSGITLFLNSSVTAIQVISQIKDLELTIITNYLAISTMPLPPKARIWLSGGEYHHLNEALFGEWALSSLSNLSADIAVIGCSGISSSSGVTFEHEDSAKLTHEMIQHTSNLVIVLADYRKIGFSADYIASDLKPIDILITDSNANAQAIREIKAQGVLVIQVDVPTY